MNALKTLICPNCGSPNVVEIEGGTYHCQNCNTSSILERPDDGTNQPKLVTVAEQTTEKEKDRKGFRWGHTAAWGGLILFLAIVGLGMMITQKGRLGLGDRSPDFTLSTFDGQQISLSSLKGKVVVVNFWASWCIPCEQEAADMEAAWNYYKPDGEVVFLGVDYVDTEPEAKAYLAKYNITYPNGPDLGTRISQAYHMTGVPETYIFDRNGKLSYTKIGPFQSLQEIQSVINPLLKP